MRPKEEHALISVEARPGPGTPTEPGPPRTILVVDDEPDMRENVVRILRRGRFACLTAGSGREAVEILDRDRPDLVLTDLRMPGMGGLALLREVGRRAPGTPVVVFTAYATPSNAEEARHAGAVAFLAKPFSAAQLLEVVHRALDRRGTGGRP